MENCTQDTRDYTARFEGRVRFIIDELCNANERIRNTLNYEMLFKTYSFISTSLPVFLFQLLLYLAVNYLRI